MQFYLHRYLDIQNASCIFVLIIVLHIRTKIIGLMQNIS